MNNKLNDTHGYKLCAWLFTKIALVKNFSCSFDLLELGNSGRPVIGENRQLVTDEPVEFEKVSVEGSSRLQENHRSF